MKRDPIYGIMAEFDTPQALVDAAHATHQAGYQKIDAYSPFPVEGLAEEIGFHRDEVPLVVLIGGIVGGLTGYLMQYWMSAVAYPLNIGGKPPHSWPAFQYPAARTPDITASRLASSNTTTGALPPSSR